MHGWTLPGFVALEQPNLLGEPEARADLSFGSSIDMARGQIDAARRAELHVRLSALSKRMKGAGGLWRDRLADPRSGAPAGPDDNPDHPAGYTYLLQFIAHDMVDSGLAMGAPGSQAGVINARRRPLMLDSLYGPGPDGALWAYEAEPYNSPDPFLNEPGRMPRNLLRASPCAGAAPAGAPFCPFHDIGRAGAPEPTDPLVADGRNDAHPLMAQMTALLHLAHNAFMRRIADADIDAAVPGVELAYRKFACARALLTLVYRRILRDDVLPRILHPEVEAAYRVRRGGKPLMPHDGVPVEFSRGAFRFAHALVRDRYVFNRFSNLPENVNFLMFSSRRRPERMPLDASWMVDWSLFFDLRDDPAAGLVANLGHRIGPHYRQMLERSNAFQDISEADISGLAQRDMTSALYAGQWSVPALFDRIRARIAAGGSGLDGVALAPYDQAWRPLVEAWLTQPFGGDAIEGPALDAAMIAAIADDPPWPFFTVFEAAFAPGDLALSTAGLGRTLGRLGSIVVAETIFAALDQHRVIEDEWELSLDAAAAKAIRLHLGDADILPELTGRAGGAPADMAGLLRLLVRLKAFAPPA